MVWLPGWSLLRLKIAPLLKVGCAQWKRQSCCIGAPAVALWRSAAGSQSGVCRFIPKAARSAATCCALISPCPPALVLLVAGPCASLLCDQPCPPTSPPHTHLAAVPACYWLQQQAPGAASSSDMLKDLAAYLTLEKAQVSKWATGRSGRKMHGTAMGPPMPHSPCAKRWLSSAALLLRHRQHTHHLAP